MHTIAKITPADYPDLLAAVDAGISQRELARRYGCTPSLVARHVARAKRARAPGEPARGRDPGLTADPHTGSTREILDARIRDPKTSARDLASLVNARARLDAEETPGSDAELRTQLLGAKRRIRELEAVQFRGVERPEKARVDASACLEALCLGGVVEGDRQRHDRVMHDVGVG